MKDDEKWKVIYDYLNDNVKYDDVVFESVE